MADSPFPVYSIGLLRMSVEMKLLFYRLVFFGKTQICEKS